MFDRLAFVPLDLPYFDIDIATIKDIYNRSGFDHYPYHNLWKAVTVYADTDDFTDPQKSNYCWENRYDKTAVPTFNNNLTKDEINFFKNIIDHLPFEKCVISQILNQVKSIPLHQDGLYDGRSDDLKGELQKGATGFNDEIEPAGLKVLLSYSAQSHKNFYLSETLTSKKRFINLPTNVNAFAINERTFFHGAKYIKSDKFILSSFGVIDKKRHEDLILRSYKKYKDYAIEF